MWIEKNGVRLAQQQGIVPANVIRVNKYIGKSNWFADSPLVGAVLSIVVTNKSAMPPQPAPSVLSPIPPLPSPVPQQPTAVAGFVIKEITGPFDVQVSARFDNVNGFFWQRLFDFGNGPQLDNVWLGQRENTNDMVLEVWRDQKMYRVVAARAIVNGETVNWKCGVDATGLMWIEKNGVRLAQQQGIVPANVIRVNKYIGKSNWSADAPLRGSVLSLAVTNK
jgi:hypothetical protein